MVAIFEQTIVRFEDELEQYVQPLREKVAWLEETVVKLEADVAKLAIKANDNEQYSRRYNIRVSGLPEEKDENCADKAVKFCQENLETSNITFENIDRAHHVGRPKKDGVPTAIIVRFKSHSDKVTVMKARKKLRDTSYFISEDLSRVNQDIYRTGCLNVASVWTTDGRIFVKRQIDDNRFQIIKHSDFIEYGFM